MQSAAAYVQRLEREGSSLESALLALALDPARLPHERAQAARLHSVSRDGVALQSLLLLFQQQAAPEQVLSTAQVIEDLRVRRAVKPLVHILLHDQNQERRWGAARALGWTGRPGAKALQALAYCLSDRSAPVELREAAAESLANVGNASTADALIQGVADPDPRVRFWSVCGLGGSCGGVPKAVRALEAVLQDEAIPAGWWAVGKEALGVLGSMDPPLPHYGAMMAEEIEAVFRNPSATKAEQSWAGFYWWGPEPASAETPSASAPDSQAQKTI
ncbi:MAG: HEAT repeat domain-containing protein [Bryobacterales bacterium]|nr:HEAT repeat domain-containing protein [Bryobacterales bacterium]